MKNSEIEIEDPEILGLIKRFKVYDKNSLLTFVDMKLRNICKDNGFKKLESVNARKFFEDKVFMSEVEIGLWIIYTIQHFDKDGRGFSVSIIQLGEFKTKGGTVYLFSQPPKGDEANSFICLTAHFFDRYKERNSLTGKRIDVIRKFFKEFMPAHLIDKNVNVVGDEESVPTCVYIKSGIMLGYIYNNYVMYKTFVSKDSIRDQQYMSHNSSLEMIINKVKNDEEINKSEEKYLKRFIDEEMERLKNQQQNQQL